MRGRVLCCMSTVCIRAEYHLLRLLAYAMRDQLFFVFVSVRTFYRYYGHLAFSASDIRTRCRHYLITASVTVVSAANVKISLR